MKPLVIVGDSILDVDVEGSATRLSPEAPVPVVDAERVWHRPGGAGLAALLATRTDNVVALITGLADDDAGHRLRDLLSGAGVRVIALPVSGHTVTKTRIRARGQSMLRLDRGDAYPIDGPLPREAVDILRNARAVCVADYGAGVTALPSLRDALTHIAGDVPIVWDPHPRGTEPVAGCALVTPNSDEAAHFCGDAANGELLRARWRADTVCITMGGRGARIYPADGPSAHIPVPEHATAAPAAADVCGAGDRFTVAAAAALAGGATPAQAVASAVSDAARFVAAGGAAAVSTPAPAQNMENISAPGGFDETATLDAFAHAERLRRAGRTVVATGGCFDLLHTGHIRMLHRARQLGDALIVLVNSDASVRALKGPDRPVMAAADRARVLAALACVDAVAVFDAATPERALERLRPDVWVKGGDYTVDQLPEADVVTRHGGEVVILPTIAGYSSSNLIAAARTSHGRT